VVVWGASPGIGKSTLCAGLAERLAATGQRVDHFREEEIQVDRADELSPEQVLAVVEERLATVRARHRSA
jgi:nucleoside-triphosphatase THEP1